MYSGQIKWITGFLALLHGYTFPKNLPHESNAFNELYCNSSRFLSEVQARRALNGDCEPSNQGHGNRCTSSLRCRNADTEHMRGSVHPTRRAPGLTSFSGVLVSHRGSRSSRVLRRVRRGTTEVDRRLDREYVPRHQVRAWPRGDVRWAKKSGRRVARCRDQESLSPFPSAVSSIARVSSSMRLAM